MDPAANRTPIEEAIDRMLANPRLTDEVKEQLRSLQRQIEDVRQEPVERWAS